MRAAGTMIVLGALLAACRTGAAGQGTGAKGWADPRPGWPLMLEGVEDVGVGELLFVPDGLVVAGTAKHGVTVGGRLLSEVPGPFVVAVDLYGAPRWVRTLECDGMAGIDGMALVGGGDVLFSGWFEGSVRSSKFRLDSKGAVDCMVGRAKADGTLAWLRSLGSPGKDFCRKLALAGDGTVWVAGSYEGPWNTGPAHDGGGASRGMSDVVVIGLKVEDGSTVGTIEFGSAGDDMGRSVAVAGEGLLVAGTFGGPFGVDEKLRLRQGEAVMDLSDTISLRQTGDYDGFVLSVGADGAVRWATAIASPGFDAVTHAVADGDGVIVTGTMQPEAPPEGVPGLASDMPMQGFVSRLDAQGQIEWTWTDPLFASGQAIAVLRDRVAVLGHHRDGLDVGVGPWRVAGSTGVTLALLDRQSGTPVGGYGCDGPGNDFGQALAATPDGRVAIAGRTRGPGGCAPQAGEDTVGFVRLMALDAQGQLRALTVE
jgi:hypothetical protein